MASRSDAQILLHIGASKCGSSALQAALSCNPRLTSKTGREFEYVAISKQGALLRDEALSQSARRSVLGYKASQALASQADIDVTALGLAKIPREESESVFILSHESWYTAGKVFAEQRLLADNHLRADVLMYIRPTLDWLNSAWWQWGAWTGASRENWMDKAVQSLRWREYRENWQTIAGVESFSLKLMPEDIVADFSEFLGAPIRRGEKLNSSSDAQLLRVMQKHRVLRPNPWDCRLEAIVNRWAPKKGSPAPWVIPHHDGKKYLELLRPDYEALLEGLEPAQAEAMRADPRWWSVDPYENRIVEPSAQQSLAIADYVEVSTRLFIGGARFLVHLA